MSIDTDEHGRLIGFRYHDGSLNGVQITEHNNLHLQGCSVCGENFQLNLQCVDLFALDEFREGNTINTMYLWSFLDAPKTVISKISKKFGLDNALMDVKYGSSDEFFIFVLECSYGAEILAISKTVSRLDG
jgi:hypothetical protein